MKTLLSFHYLNRLETPWQYLEAKIHLNMYRIIKGDFFFFNICSSKAPLQKCRLLLINHSFQQHLISILGDGYPAQDSRIVSSAVKSASNDQEQQMQCDGS